MLLYGTNDKKLVLFYVHKRNENECILLCELAQV